MIAVHTRLRERLKASETLFADESTAPVLAPGRGRIKASQLWAYARAAALPTRVAQRAKRGDGR